jgi:hypothetical protein
MDLFPVSSALNFAIPAFGPLLTLVVDDAPVYRVELGGALADQALDELDRNPPDLICANY